MLAPSHSKLAIATCGAVVGSSMQTSIEFLELLRLIDERSVAFRAAVASAPSLEMQVPTCPEWTLLDLAQHLANSHRRWAATVAVGPANGPPHETAWAGAMPATETGVLLAWSAESTGMLLSALREAGPDRGCWTWWGGSQSPSTCGAVARHQLQHVTVHTYDAQMVWTAAEPLPGAVALDGIDEFLSTCVAGTDPWPHEPAAVEYHATDGGSWRLSLSAAGAHVTPLLLPGTMVGTAADVGGLAAPVASLCGTASELVLAFYGRVPSDDLQVTGDGHVFDQLLAWDPDA